MDKTFKYHSTTQFRQVVKNTKLQASFKGVGEDGKAIHDPLTIFPTVDYIGTVKLHGTNASIMLHDDSVVSFHSKEKTLGYVKDGEFTLNMDNAGFAGEMWCQYEGVKTLLEKAKETSITLYGEVRYPLKVSGEWAGPGVQKGVGISGVEGKTFFVFGLKIGDQGWCSPLAITELHSLPHKIDNITGYKTFNLAIDFNSPEDVQNTLADLTMQVEKECPVAKRLGVEGDLIGEGIVWIPSDPARAFDSGSWFKTKGQKHSTSKVKKVASICPEKLSSIKEFVEYATTDNRLKQGVSEVGLDQKLIGAFIGWVNKDILKEEADTLATSGLTMKGVGKYISTKARTYYLTELQKVQ